jgi:cation diffusion facilitator CzcD-associated flavoprotein CzcO
MRGATNGVREPERVETVVVGGGQAGLAVGYHLARRGLPFVILDANERIGDSWRSRWDSLRLFTPARHDGLDGMSFPASRHSFPTKDEMADYLEAYAARFELPVRTGVRVDRLARNGAPSSWPRTTCTSRPTTWWWRCRTGRGRGGRRSRRSSIQPSSSFTPASTATPLSSGRVASSSWEQATRGPRSPSR